MPRPKGSKNKAKARASVTKVPQLRAARDALLTEQQEVEKVLAEQTAKLKDIKKRVRALDREIQKLELKESEAQAAAQAEEAKKLLNGKIEELVQSGVSVEDILNKLR